MRANYVQDHIVLESGALFGPYFVRQKHMRRSYAVSRQSSR